VSLFVDTSVWSLAFRRESPPETAEVQALVRAIEAGELIFSTGIVLQELLQGFSGPKAREQILDRFAAIPLIVPDRTDHIDAADLRNRCRRAGVQAGTIDVLLAQLCLRHGLTMLSADGDFRHIAGLCALKLWAAPS
jgi:predicted nucleic acid-binding protein